MDQKLLVSWSISEIPLILSSPNKWKRSLNFLVISAVSESSAAVPDLFRLMARHSPYELVERLKAFIFVILISCALCVGCQYMRAVRKYPTPYYTSSPLKLWLCHFYHTAGREDPMDRIRKPAPSAESVCNVSSRGTESFLSSLLLPLQICTKNIWCV
jgi:hypothetical protein